MTIKNILNAATAIQKIMELKLPIKKAHAIYFLAKQINEQRDFFIKEEKKLIEKFNAEVDDQGLVTFKTPELKTGFLQEHNALKDFDILDIQPIELSFEDLDKAELAPTEIMQLEDVITFVD